MANIEQGLRSFSKHRYSVKQLLAMSGNAYGSFDLSKFSFDAARAGVIPSLGDCAASSRRTSATRLCVSSIESASTTDDIVVSPDPDPEVPERRPQPPPFSVLSQQHTGFARFLKKHSSPTHQRVTAGGRIVPMEPCHGPPIFQLDINAETRTERMSVAREQKSLVVPTHSKDPQEGLPDNAKSTTSLQSRKRSITSQLGSAYLGQDAPVMNQWGQQPLHAMHPVSMHNGNMPSHYPPTAGMENMLTPYPGVTAGNCSAYGLWHTPYTSPNTILYPTIGVWPYGDDTTPIVAQCHVNDPSHLAQPIIWAHSALSEWSQRYSELDQQLKSLDRHRAMTNLTSDIAVQRREIVQQRADSKNMINLIATWLNLSEQVQPAVNPPLPGSPFNADAPAYIPTTQPAPVGEARADHVESRNGAAQEEPFKKPPIRSARRPIAIVPPPKLQTNIPPRQQHGYSPDSPGRNDVDTWGVKIGPAPLELRLQQSEILESISEARSLSSRSNQSRESLQLAPQGGFFQHDIKEASPNSIVEYNSAHKHQTRLEHVPPVIEAMYEEGLDALRKPKGAITAVRMPDGFLFDVKGQELQRPDSGNMSLFEKDYWSRKPTPQHIMAQSGQDNEVDVPKRITTTPASQMVSLGNQGYLETRHSIKGDDKENITITPYVHRKAATDAFLARYSGSKSPDEISFSRYDAKSLQSHDNIGQDMSQRGPLNKYNNPYGDRFGAVKLTNRTEMPFRPEVPNFGHVSAGNADGIEAQVTERTYANRPGSVSTDIFNNKGYSSISVQNVHASAQLPQNLDGTTDGGKSSKSIFTLVGKVRSPRLLRRNTANGGT